MPRSPTYPQKDAYLKDKDVEMVLAAMRIDDSERNRETVLFIKQKEKLNAQYVLGRISSAELLAGIRKVEDEFRDKYHNEIHHGNKTLEDFYETINKKYSNIVHWVDQK